MSPNDRYDSLFQHYGGLYKIAPNLLKAQCRAESNFLPDAESKAGAAGLMQFMPRTFLEVATKLKLRQFARTNPEHSIHCAAYYMRMLLDRYGNDARYALAAYNWGMGRVDGSFKDAPPWEDDVQRMPKETQLYVARICGFYEEYEGRPL